MRRIFEERERAFEAKWAHGQEVQFKTLVSRNKLLGRWVAAEMGLSGEWADRYVIDVVQVGVLRADENTMFEKIRADLHARKIYHSDAVIRKKMDDFFEPANAHILGNG